MVLIIWPVRAQTQLNVLTVVSTIFLGPMYVRSGKRKKEIMKVKVTKNLTYLEARKIVEHTPETTFSTIIQSAIAKPETKHDYTQTADNDKIISSSTKVLIPTKYKTNKPQPPSKATTPQSKQTATKPKPTAQANTSTIEQPKNRESRSKTGTSPRKKSRSPKKNHKERQIKLTRVQDEPIKTGNKYSDLEQMEAEVSNDEKSSRKPTQKFKNHNEYESFPYFNIFIHFILCI